VTERDRPRHSFRLYYPASFQILLSFPTRRSSDLALRIGLSAPIRNTAALFRASDIEAVLPPSKTPSIVASGIVFLASWVRYIIRSEEHTSELQSRENLVCRLLLEKKTNM